MNTFSITPKGGGEQVLSPVRGGLTLAQHLYLAGAFSSRPLCSGAGRCGLCQVRFITDPPEPLPVELQRISSERLERGWRLSCVRQPTPGSSVEAALAPPTLLPETLSGGCPGGHLGIDLGTTSIHWRFESGSRVLSGSFHNPQLGAGSEVMSRLALAAHPDGAARLRQAAAQAVFTIIKDVGCIPESICLAGNTCMTSLALGLDVSGLSAAPYRVDWPGDAVATLDEALPQVYIPPLPAPFVGGDISAGLAALEFSDRKPTPPYLLADLGTNGEFALALPDGRFLLASVPMGPALEGVGMRRGMLAGPGAAVAFGLSPRGLEPVLYAAGASGASVKGISGTGYVSLLARLITLGVVSPSGRFERGAASPLAARVLAGLGDEDGEPCLDVGGSALFASDVEALLKVKAAFGAAVKILLAEAGLAFSDLHAVLLAGSLGEHVSSPDLEVLGFLPPGGAGTVRAVGNSSLDGACLAAGRKDVRRWLGGLAARTQLVDVVAVPDFQTMYLDSMRFSHVR
ncbi:ASKHA domain-containing protein [Fundidesulfovibrio putealis]|uniref:ASKHA domain-containing protein n=1 Tax=Fundidesulfovibrio putealis TaxID=270496 RepID=UPI0003F950B5|nr:ASKHA domain-containing protein [Fundidesulfovibrio putealis]